MITEKIKSPIEALKQFIDETPLSELKSLVAKYEKMDMPGPTYQQYLEELQEQLDFTSTYNISCTTEWTDYSSMDALCLLSSPAIYEWPRKSIRQSSKSRLFKHRPKDRYSKHSHKKRPREIAGSFFYCNIVS